MEGQQAPLGGSDRSTLRALLERRLAWLDALIILSVIAVGFVVLGFLATYFQAYFHIILIFFFAWLLAFLLTPPAAWVERHVPHLARPIAVLVVLAPIILIGAFVAIRVVVSISESLVALVQALPALQANPPGWVYDLQRWLDAQGVAVDAVGIFQTMVGSFLEHLSEFALGIFKGVVEGVPIIIDAIVVISLAVFMTIDRDRIFRFGIELTPPAHREEMLLFRDSVARAFSGFIKSQLVLGALYAVWALGVSLVLGLSFAPATAFLAGAIMAIPIYGPYVSWLPPVLVAMLTRPELAIITAVLMLVGWFIDENILAPIVRAGAVELHPIVVMAAFLLGAQLAGAIGALVGIPIAAIISSFFFFYVRRHRERQGRAGERLAEGTAEGPAAPGSPSPAAPDGAGADATA